MISRAVFFIIFVNSVVPQNKQVTCNSYFFEDDQEDDYDDSLTFTKFTKFGQICGGGYRHTRKTVIGCSIVYLSSTSAPMSRLHKFHNLCDIGRSKVFPALRCILSTGSFSCAFPL